MRLSRGLVAMAMTGLVVLAGSVQVADAALPIKTKTCGAKVKASFRLANDLDCSGIGLKVAKAGIVIHLNGHTISGSGPVGIDNSKGFAQVTIRNGTVSFFDVGIKIGRTTRNTVRGISSLTNGFEGILIKGGSGHKIIGSEISGNGEQGIDFVGKASTFKGNTLEGNGEEGILAVVKAGMKILDNRLIENGDDGIDLRGKGATITGNFACGNGAVEIKAAKAGNVIKDNETHDLCS
jgi:hypothetical protein